MRSILGFNIIILLSILLLIVILLIINLVNNSSSDLELNNCQTIEISPNEFTVNCTVMNDILSSLTSELSQLIFFFSIFPIIIILLWLVLRFLHKRNFLSIISWNNKFRWKRFFLGIGMMFSIAILLLTISYFIFPNNFELIFELKWFLYLIPVALLIFIQVSAEELFFRGYLTQTVGYFTRKNLFIFIIPSLFFALAHSYNPEVASFGFIIMLIYFIIGLFLSLITLLDNGLEIAIGFHLANNLFSGMFVAYKDSVIGFLPAILRQKEIFINFELLMLILGLTLFVIIVYKDRIKKKIGNKFKLMS